MKYEESRLKSINSIMEDIHSVCDDIYEGLVDEDYESVKFNLRTLSDLIDYVRKSVSNEI